MIQANVSSRGADSWWGQSVHQPERMIADMAGQNRRSNHGRPQAAATYPRRDVGVDRLSALRQADPHRVVRSRVPIVEGCPPWRMWHPTT
jgi:hypothetical protein